VGEYAVTVFRRRNVDKELLDAARLIARAQKLRDAGRFRDSAGVYAELVRRFDEWPERREEGLRPSLSALGETLWKSGDLAGAAQTYDRLAEYQQERGHLEEAEFAWEAGARISGEAHELDDSESRARKAVAAARELGNPVIEARAVQVLAHCLFLRGRADEAEESLLPTVDVDGDDSNDATWVRCSTYELLTRIAIQRGDAAAAHSWATRLQDALPANGAADERRRQTIRELLTQVLPVEET
jgi:ATP/maltotriose-dependent transcriptional regulator MalT